MSVSMRSFVRRAERQSKQSIRESYVSIDLIHDEINFLNQLLDRYMNHRGGLTYTHSQRRKIIDEIRERIPAAYKDINYYKECINAEKKEIKRIHETYGYFDEPQYIQDDCETHTDVHNSYYQDTEDGDNYTDIHEDDLEEIKEYKYNYATGVFE